MNEDPVIQRVREARHKISAKCDHDPQKLVNYYIELQEKYKDRLLKSMGEKPAEPIKA